MAEKLLLIGFVDYLNRFAKLFIGVVVGPHKFDELTDIILHRDEIFLRVQCDLKVQHLAGSVKIDRICELRPLISVRLVQQTLLVDQKRAGCIPAHVISHFDDDQVDFGQRLEPKAVDLLVFFDLQYVDDLLAALILLPENSYDLVDLLQVVIGSQPDDLHLPRPFIQIADLQLLLQARDVDCPILLVLQKFAAFLETGRCFVAAGIFALALALADVALLLRDDPHHYLFGLVELLQLLCILFDDLSDQIFVRQVTGDRGFEPLLPQAEELQNVLLGCSAESLQKPGLV